MATVKISEQYLKEALLAKGLKSEEIDEVLSEVRAKLQIRRRKAVLVRATKMGEDEIEKVRKEQVLKLAERTFYRQNRPLDIAVLPVSVERTISIVRQGEEVTIWELRPTVRKARPSTKRQVAQNLSPVRVRSYDVRRVIVSRPDKAMVLSFPSGRSGIRLTSDLLKKRPTTVRVKWQSDGREFEILLPADEWRIIVQTYRCLRKKMMRMQVSVDGERWFRVVDVIGNRNQKKKRR